MQPFSLRWLIPLTLVVLLLPACSDSGDDGVATSAPAPSTTTSPATTSSTTTAGPTELPGNSDPGVPAAVMSSIEGFNEAGSAYDTALMRMYLTDDFTWQSTGPITTLDDYLAYVDANWERMEFRYEATGEPVIHLDGETYVVEEPGLATATSLEMVGTSVYRLVELGDQWLIQEYRWIDAPTSEATG